MRVTILYFAQIRKATNGIAEEHMELPAGARLTDAIAAAIARHPAIAPHTKSLLVTRNEEWSQRSAELRDGDVVGLMPPVSGG